MRRLAHTLIGKLEREFDEDIDGNRFCRPAQVDKSANVEERGVKDFLILHYGFEKPTPEEMGSWNKWFESITDKQVVRGHFPGGREISPAGTKDLPLAQDSITGYTVIRAEDLDNAEEIAKGCPIVASTRVYEIM